MFHYSAINHAVASGNLFESMNLHWNQMQESLMAQNSMFMVPSFNPAVFNEFPLFAQFGNNILNPMFAIQKTLQQFNGNNWMNGGMGGFQFPMCGGSQQSGGSGDKVDTAAQYEYDSLRTLIKKYKEKYDNKISSKTIAKIDEALNKSGNTEEKLEVLKDLYKKLTKTSAGREKMEDALLEVKAEALVDAGYDFKDEQSSSDANKLHEAIIDKKNPFGAITVKSDNVLILVSAWNNQYNTDTEKGIIRCIAENLPEKADEQGTQKAAVTSLVQALIMRAGQIEFESGDSRKSNFDKLKKNLNEARTKVVEDFNKDSLKTLADAFDALYGATRILAAEDARNLINADYNFLNDIDANDVDIVTRDTVVKDTEEDLKAEGIKTNFTANALPEDDGIFEEEEADEFEDLTPEQTVDKLVEDKDLKPVEADSNVYTTSTDVDGEKPRYYQLKADKFVEVKNAKYDAETKKLVKAGTEELEYEEVNTKDELDAIVNYSKALQEIDQNLNKDPKKFKRVSKINGVQIYQSIGCDEKGKHQYFQIKDNKLVKVECELVNNKLQYALKDGKIQVSNYDSNDVLVTNKKIEAQKAEEEAAKKAEAEKTRKLQAENQGKDYGKIVSDDLVGVTNKDEWNNVSDIIKNKLDKDNIRGFIIGYTDDDDLCGSDNLLEQIATENGRSSEAKKELIEKIIKLVLEYCDENNWRTDSEAYKLLSGYNESGKITKKVLEDETGIIRDLDHAILDLFDIDNK